MLLLQPWPLPLPLTARTMAVMLSDADAMHGNTSRLAPAFAGICRLGWLFGSHACGCHQQNLSCSVGAEVGGGVVRLGQEAVAVDQPQS